MLVNFITGWALLSLGATFLACRLFHNGMSEEL